MADKTITRRLNIYVNGKEVENSLGGIQAGSKKVWNEMRKLDKASADYDVTLQKLTKDYKALKQAEADWKAQLKETPSLLGKIKNQLGPVATGMLTAFSVQGVVNAFFDKLQEGWKIVKEFDQKQADLAGTLQTTKLGIARLTADAIKFGSTTSFNATQVSELQIELAKLGKTQEEIRSMTAAVLNGATALEAGLGPAAELVGGQLNSYKEGADQARRYSDVMAQSVNISATSFESLNTALPKASAIAYQAKVPFEELNAVLGVLADANIAAETAGTGFRNILLTSAEAGKPYEEMLKKVAMASDKTKKATELFGKENAAVAVILATSTDKINANTKALENSAGAAEKLAKEKLNSIKGAVENFSGAWEGFILSLEKGDGWLAKVARDFLQLGASILNAITPTQQLSDEIRNEQVELNKLVGKITSSNTKNDERKRLLIQLKEEYPDFIKNLNTETITNEELFTALSRVNGEYAKRIVLQKEQEKIDKIANKQAEAQEKYIKYYDDLLDRATKANIDYKLNMRIDEGDLVNSATKIADKLKQMGEGVSVTGPIYAAANSMKRMTFEVGEYGKQIDVATIKMEKHRKALGIASESEKELLKLREQALAFGMKNAMKAPEAEVRAYVAAQKELQSLRKDAAEQGLADADKYSADYIKKWLLNKAKLEAEDTKANEKAAAKAAREREQRIRDEHKLQKDLQESRKAANDANLDIMAEGYEKEKQQANEEFAQKIADLQLKQKTEAEIKQVQDKLAVAKKAGKSDQVAYYEKQLADMLAINKNYSAAIVSAEQQRMIKIAGIQEKYLLKEVQRTEDANQSELQALQTKQAYEMAGFTSLQKAKGELANYLSKEELSKVKTLEDAKLALKKVHARQEYELQEKHLLDMMALWQGLLGQEVETGIPIFSEEQRKDILKFLDEAALKVAEIQEGKAATATGKPSAEQRNDQINLTSGLDVLGMSPDQWEQIYANIDTYKGKLQAIGAVAGALQQAFSAYFNYVNASEQASLSKYERSVNKKKKALDNQLDRGFISQGLYNARVAALDEELEKKKARIAYKQAKRERAMSVASIISNTALAIMGIWAQVPKFDFGATAGIMSGLVAALGAVQLGTVLATPLPSPEGFKKGGYTGDGNANDIAGPAHKGEYIIPKDVLFSKDPMIPQIVGYVEAKRKGRQGFMDGGFTSDDSEFDTSVNKPAAQTQATGNAELTAALNKNSEFLEQLLAEGVTGFVVVDVKAAKRIREKQRELEKIENTAKG